MFLATCHGKANRTWAFAEPQSASGFRTKTKSKDQTSAAAAFKEKISKARGAQLILGSGPDAQEFASSHSEDRKRAFNLL
jgi:hypothetical protein